MLTHPKKYWSNWTSSQGRAKEKRSLKPTTSKKSFKPPPCNSTTPGFPWSWDSETLSKLPYCTSTPTQPQDIVVETTGWESLEKHKNTKTRHFAFLGCRGSQQTRTQGLLECLSNWNLATYPMKKRKITCFFMKDKFGDWLLGNPQLHPFSAWSDYFWFLFLLSISPESSQPFVLLDLVQMLFEKVKHIFSQNVV